MRILLALLAMAGVTWGDTHTAASAEYAACSTAIFQAAEGDIVVIPSDTSSWDTCVYVTKPISIIGAGKTKTKLTTGATHKMSLGYFRIVQNSSTLCRVSGINFELYDNKIAPNYSITVAVGSAVNKLVIDSCEFNKGCHGVVLNGCKGVAFGNTFINSFGCFSLQAGTNEQADTSWNVLEMGSSDAFFMENNLWIINADWTSNNGIDHFFDISNGGKFVARYNEVDADNAPDALGQIAAWQWHGNAGAGLPNNQLYWQQGYGARRGPAIVELYENYAHGKRLDYLCFVRGASCLIYDNVITSTNSTPTIYFNEDEVGPYNIPSRVSWPGEDQVNNTFIWGNTFNGTNRFVNVSDTSNLSWGYNESKPLIQINRDIWFHAPQSSGGYEYYTGRNGGSSSYPTDGELYPTLGNMVFSSTGANAYYPYTAYTYPHPMISEIAGKTCTIRIRRPQ
jgi:hypothetical protein